MPNKPIGEAAFGTVSFVYYNRADYEALGRDAQALGSTPIFAGDYVLVAVAISTEPGHDELVAAVNFSIYKSNENILYYAIIGVLGGIILFGLALIILVSAVKHKRKKAAKAAAADDDESNAEETDDNVDGDEEYSEDFSEEEMDDMGGDVQFDEDPDENEIHIEHIDEDAPAIEPTFID